MSEVAGLESDQQRLRTQQTAQASTTATRPSVDHPPTASSTRPKGSWYGNTKRFLMTGDATKLTDDEKAQRAAAEESERARKAAEPPVKGFGYAISRNAARIARGEAPKITGKSFHVEAERMRQGVGAVLDRVDSAADAMPHAPDFNPQLAAGASPNTPRYDGKAPGQAMREAAMNAEGSTDKVRAAQGRIHKADAVREATDSTVGGLASKAVEKVTGVDAQELAAHGTNAVKIQALNEVYNDPARQGAYHLARAQDIGASRDLESSVGGWKGEDDPTKRKAAARKAVGAAGRKVLKNLRLGAATEAVGKQSGNLDEWQVKHTVGKSDPTSPDAGTLGRVGGLDSGDNVAPEKMERTTLGAIAQGTRAGGKIVERAGNVLGGSSEHADEAIKQGRLTEAAVTTGMGVGKQVAAGVTNAVGAGAAVTEGIDTAASVLKYGGKGLAAAGDYAAQGQDQRDRQRELTTGERRNQASGTAINWRGAETEHEATLKEKAGGAVRDAAKSKTDAVRNFLGIKKPQAAPDVTPTPDATPTPTAAKVVHQDTNTPEPGPAPQADAGTQPIPTHDSATTPEATTPEATTHEPAAPEPAAHEPAKHETSTEPAVLTQPTKPPKPARRPAKRSWLDRMMGGARRLAKKGQKAASKAWKQAKPWLKDQAKDMASQGWKTLKPLIVQHGTSMAKRLLGLN